MVKRKKAEENRETHRQDACAHPERKNGAHDTNQGARTMNEEMKRICDYLEGRGFELLSIKEHYVQIYKKNNLLVKVEDKEKKP